jgi:uncharacterized glyoxalase superfamily protein PhnB
VLSLDVIALGVPDVPAARTFYAAAFSPVVADHGDYVGLDLHGSGELGLIENEALATDAGTVSASDPSGFRGYVLNAIVSQPSEVKALLAAAVAGGATVLKPAKGGLFGEFSAVYQAPDGAIWKLAAASKRDKGPAGTPPRPTETVLLLGVASPKAAKTFYSALGMTVDRDYGDTFIDFHLAPGKVRVGLMPRKELAKDAGVKADGAGFPAMIPNRRAVSRAEVDATLEAAAAAGGQITIPAAEEGWGGYAGHFTDPDGFMWKIACVG